MTTPSTDRAYELAREQYAALGVDTAAALQALNKIPISLQCWQGDDVGGFESDSGLTGGVGGGIQATGNYPGKARTPDELRSDLRLALSCIPGKHRVNLHAIYGDFHGNAPPRDQITPAHFAAWIDWAKHQKIGLDFNPTCFSHPLADDGFTLASRDDAKRDFWIRHCIACRKIGEAFGRALATPCVTNIWIPDGYKDTPVDRLAPRLRLQNSLDEIFAEAIDTRFNRDAVEGKLFGIGSESYVVGSHEFYLGYAVKNKKLLCIDSGHFHPTESIADKLSAVLCHLDEILLHVSRGVHWDSDHVVILNDDLRAIAEELVRGSFLGTSTTLPRVHIGLDFFDASINRVAAWIIGTRAMQKALLLALLEPTEKLRTAETAGDFTTRLALLEEIKSLPFGAVWNQFCESHSIDPGLAWLQQVKAAERS